MYEAKFRMIVFRPFASEVILAKVKSSDEEAIRLSVGFFDDMYIPIAYLPQPSAFDPNERAHFWLPESEATTSHELLESATADRMYVDQGEIIRVRVEVDEFYDDEPGPPKAAEGVVIKREARRAPYTIIVRDWDPCPGGRAQNQIVTWMKGEEHVQFVAFLSLDRTIARKQNSLHLPDYEYRGFQ
ncbi:RNA polymerase III subunit Rpc25-domain-containing protein [Butyriboletus roseoflavus]|nr:RNA polymerase III subunit Rpc25-domain-containing protein [Butyriboletus roseoflavus]